MTDLLLPGAAAPWFHAPALGGNPRFAFDTAAGRPIVLLLMGSASLPATAQALETLQRHRTLFDDNRAAFFGVSIDPEDIAAGRIAPQLPGIRWFVDGDGSLSQLYGAELRAEGERHYRPHWLLLDRAQRVVLRTPLSEGETAMAALQALIAEDEVAASVAPVLIVPRVLEPELCRHLIALYRRHGGADSGFMREEDGITVEKIDHSHKRRADFHIEDEALKAALRQRLVRSLVPQIERAFQFHATRVERWLVACYDGDNGGGHFRAHRDNTTKGTAHRKFACTINLNAGDYDGGDLRFPEFGERSYRAPTGGAVIFSCSLLHEALPVTRGRRFAFLPFLYDDAGARLRERNTAFVTGALANYRSGLPNESSVTAPVVDETASA